MLSEPTTPSDASPEWPSIAELTRSITQHGTLRIAQHNDGWIVGVGASRTWRPSLQGALVGCLYSVGQCDK